MADFIRYGFLMLLGMVFAAVGFIALFVSFIAHKKKVAPLIVLLSGAILLIAGIILPIIMIAQ